MTVQWIQVWPFVAAREGEGCGAEGRCAPRPCHIDYCEWKSSHVYIHVGRRAKRVLGACIKDRVWVAEWYRVIVEECELGAGQCPCMQLRVLTASANSGQELGKRTATAGQVRQSAAGSNARISDTQAVVARRLFKHAAWHLDQGHVHNMELLMSR